LADGVRAGALLCFDNAFGDVAREHVEAGANLLAVLSNEAWYRRGAELVQMEAMAVLRAIETGVPVVRATVDGATLAVGRDGRVLARLPFGVADSLRVILEVPLTPGPVAPAARAVGLLVVLATVLGLAQVVFAWARLCWSRLRTRFGARPSQETRASA
jgi:apolipoprotein N-acyltransferase